MPSLLDPWFEARFFTDVKEGDFRHDHPTLEGAQGLMIWCPCGYGKAEYPLDGGRPHAILVPFRNPRGAPLPPEDFGPVAPDGRHPRWEVSGSSLVDLTIAPSIDVGTPSCWHGFIQQGQVR